MCITHSPEIEKLAAALAKAQGQIEYAAKDRKNDHFKNKYADLASVRAALRGPLSENGLSYVQFPDADGNKVTCETMLMHESGQWMRGKLTMAAVNPNPQGVGSAITYCRRYSLMAVIGIASDDDDDGNAASAPVPPARPEPRARRDETPFDAAPGKANRNLPAPELGSTAWSSEVNGCTAVSDLDALKRTSEFKAAYEAMTPAEKDHVKLMFDERYHALGQSNMLAAG